MRLKACSTLKMTKSEEHLTSRLRCYETVSDRACKYGMNCGKDRTECGTKSEALYKSVVCAQQLLPRGTCEVCTTPYAALNKQSCVEVARVKFKRNNGMARSNACNATERTELRWCGYARPRTRPSEHLAQTQNNKIDTLACFTVVEYNGFPEPNEGVAITHCRGYTNMPNVDEPMQGTGTT